jgi:small-conductance mechanosensitive channel
MRWFEVSWMPLGLAGPESAPPRGGFAEWRAALFAWMEHSVGISVEAQGRILTSILVVAGLWLARVLILMAAARRTQDARVQYLWRKTTFYVALVLAVLLVGRQWVTGIEDTTTFLGLLSAGLAVAFKDVLVGLAGWMYIVAQKPFRVGDRIELGEFSGDVIDSGPLMFTVLEIGKWVHADQSTGRMAQVPNAMIFSHPLVNYTKGFRFIWNEVHVLVTFESNWRGAKELLLKIASERAAQAVDQAEREIRNAAKQFMILYSKLSPTVYTSVEESGVMLSVRYLCSVHNRRDSAQAIWEDVLEKFGASEDIDFAYPTRRYYRLDSEGKTVNRRDQSPPETAPQGGQREDGAEAEGRP